MRTVSASNAKNESVLALVCMARVTEVAVIPGDDGVEFRPARFGRRPLGGKLCWDVNFGDPVTPAPREIELPARRGFQPMRILGYTPDLRVCRSVGGRDHLGPDNTRVRDLVCRL